MTIRTVSQLRNLRGRTVFLRVDFNVPLRAGRILSDYKIRSGLATIEYLASRGARLIVATHLGEPAGPAAAYSVRPVARRLQTLLKRPVKFVSAVSGPRVTAAVKKLRPGQILMSENLRFVPGEYADDPIFARALAAGADFYVNDAFAVCHRAQASVSAIKKYLPAYAGRQLEAELKALSRVRKPKKPLVIIMGGAKIGTKAPLISRLHRSASRILIGGALANNFFKYQGQEIGRSLYDRADLAAVRPFFRGRKLDAKIILPSDVVVKARNGSARVVAPAAVRPTDTILDIGPATIAAFAAQIKTAATLIWNGPLGHFEEAPFRHGTVAIATLIAARSSGRAYGIVGGGETVEALKLTKMSEYVDWISTAGGALLAYLGGVAMPGLRGIVKS